MKNKKSDYRTWWEKGAEVANELEGEVTDRFNETWECLDLLYSLEYDKIDCIMEQIWAIREGLA